MQKTKYHLYATIKMGSNAKLWLCLDTDFPVYVGSSFECVMHRSIIHVIVIPVDVVAPQG